MVIYGIAGLAFWEFRMTTTHPCSMDLFLLHRIASDACYRSCNSRPSQSIWVKNLWEWNLHLSQTSQVTHWQYDVVDSESAFGKHCIWTAWARKRCWSFAAIVGNIYNTMNKFKASSHPAVPPTAFLFKDTSSLTLLFTNYISWHLYFGYIY